MAVVQEHEKKEILCKDWLSKPKKLLIDGKWVEAKSGKTFAVVNPATEEVLCHVAKAAKKKIGRASCRERV